MLGKKVFIVFKGTDSWYGDGFLIRVFSSKKLAENFISYVADKQFLYIKEVILNEKYN